MVRPSTIRRHAPLSLTVLALALAALSLKTDPIFLRSVEAAPVALVAAVNKTVDEKNTGPNCSLREAIVAANTDSACGGCTVGSGDDVENDRVKIHKQSGAAIQSASSDNLKVVLLGTGVGPPVNLQQFGASTLIEAGGVRLLFDCGRGATLRLAQVGAPLGSISRLFLTHLHSDHVIQIPDLLLTGS